MAVSEVDTALTYPDVTSTAIPSGSVSYVGGTITLPPIGQLTRGKIYRVEILYTAGSQTIEPYFEIHCTK